MHYLKYHWEVIARDYHSPYLRNSLWTRAILKIPKFIGISYPALAIVSHKDSIEYICDFSTWRKTHENLKEKLMQDYQYFQKLIDKTISWGEHVNKWTEQNIYARDLSILSGNELITAYRQFIDMQEDEYAYGVPIPIMDFQGFSFIENNLKQYLMEHVQKHEFNMYFSLFTEPSKNSFHQDQEEALFQLIGRFYDNLTWRRDILKADYNVICQKYPDFARVLEHHTEQYAWVYYVYAGPAYTEQNFFEFIQDILRKQIDPRVKLKELVEKKLKRDQSKQVFYDTFHPNDFERFILEMAGIMVWAKPRRKDYQSKSYWHVEKLMREIARRLSISLHQARSATLDQLRVGLLDGKFDIDSVNTAYQCHACLPKDDTEIVTLIGNDAEKFIRECVKRPEDKINTLVSEYHGACAFHGRSRGVAKLINAYEDMNKMNQGDVLVSTATNPSLVPAMKKASAILTDEGGLTCHAAIVSRELEIPCVVGLKIATKVLKDGDVVEVDATNGIIKKV